MSDVTPVQIQTCLQTPTTTFAAPAAACLCSAGKATLLFKPSDGTLSTTGRMAGCFPGPRRPRGRPARRTFRYQRKSSPSARSRVMFSSVARSCSPILCKARGSERGRQLSPPRPASPGRRRGSYLPPWPRRTPGSSRDCPNGRRRPSTPSHQPRRWLRPRSRSCVFLVLACGFLSTLHPVVAVPSTKMAAPPLLSAGLKPARSRRCPQPRWRPPERPVTAPPSGSAAPGGRRSGRPRPRPGPGERAARRRAAGRGCRDGRACWREEQSVPVARGKAGG